jgi:hypothetical protein
MTIRDEQVAEIIGDEVERLGERLRAELLERMFKLRTPTFSLTPKGELFIDGHLVGDVRPMFKEVLGEVMAEQLAAARAGGNDDSGR